MRAFDVMTPLRTPVASSSIVLKTVTSPGASSIRYMPLLAKMGGVEQVACQIRARIRCTFLHDCSAAKWGARDSIRLGAGPEGGGEPAEDGGVMRFIPGARRRTKIFRQGAIARARRQPARLGPPGPRSLRDRA